MSQSVSLSVNHMMVGQSVGQSANLMMVSWSFKDSQSFGVQSFISQSVIQSVSQSYDGELISQSDGDQSVNHMMLH